MKAHFHPCMLSIVLLLMPFFSFAQTCGSATHKIHDVQGSGSSSPLSGQTVTVEGIVVADYQSSNQLNGFYLMEEDADQDDLPETSEGILVYQGNGAKTAVAVGDRVVVSGKVDEYFDLTELKDVSVEVCSSGEMLPTPAQLSLPFPSEDFAERYEGMYVRFTQDLFITSADDLADFGELVLSPGDRLLQFTEGNQPGSGVTAYEKKARESTIILDDDKDGRDNPIYHWPEDGKSLRFGDYVRELEGVLSYSFNLYRIRPLAPVQFTEGLARTATPALPTEGLRIATFNVENYFNGNGTGGGFPTSRGAKTMAEFQQQTNKLVAAISGMAPDILGVQEVENDFGAGDNSAIGQLVAALNVAAGRELYAFIQPGQAVGTDEIAVGLIYNQEKVRPEGAAAILDTPIDLFQQEATSRAVLAQTFAYDLPGQERTELLTVAVNHFKSKGRSSYGADATDDARDDDQNDGQSYWNYLRVRSAQAVINWLATDPTASEDPDFLIMGDLNAYAMEDPIRTLEEAGYVNLVQQGYTKDFNGYWGTLDYLFASESLASQFLAGVKWAINAEEMDFLQYDSELSAYVTDDAFRSSDHNPVIGQFVPGSIVDDVDDVSVNPGLLRVKELGPNPFRNRTRLELEVQKSGEVEFSVTNMQGQELVRRTMLLLNGTHQLEVSSKVLGGAGTYLYRLRMGDAVVSGRLVVVQ